MAMEELIDVEGGTHLEIEHGERFLGWYSFKTPIRKEEIPLNYKKTALKYEFTICDYNFRFVMPPKIEFVDGFITYSDGERELGIFRFPRDQDGKFCAPISLDQKKLDEMVNSPKEELDKLLLMKPPLVFEAFRIPQYGFELFDLDAQARERISKLTDIDFVESLKREHGDFIVEKTKKIKSNILSICNYLLILRNVLDHQWKDFNEISLMTNKIIHI
jgi:hypothetical protein